MTHALGISVPRSGRMQFALGKLYATPGILAVMKDDASAAYIMECLRKHATGDWGMVDADDKALNDMAVRTGNRIMSAYPLPDDGDNFWIITEADRSVTTFLLPSEY